MTNCNIPPLVFQAPISRADCEPFTDETKPGCDCPGYYNQRERSEQSQDLGSITVTRDRDFQRAIRKQDLLYSAKKLLPHENRLQACLSIRVDADKPVGVEYAENMDRARLTNVARCDNPHICPNCGPIHAEQTKRQLQEDLKTWELAGFTSIFVVLTIQHFISQSLTTTDNLIDKAIRRMLMSKPGRVFKQKWGYFGRQRNPDVTYGKNGWHSHRNMVLYLDRRPLSETEALEFEADLRQLWTENAKAVGGYADFEHGCTCKFGDIFYVADYIGSKAAGCGGGQGDHGGQDRPGVKQEWAVPEELTKHHYKKAKGLTPTELLEAYAWGDQDSGKLYQEYAAVFKGKKFVDSSPGLRAKLEALKEQYHDKLSQVLPEDEKPEYCQICYLGPKAFRQLVELQMVLWFIEELRQARGDPVKVRNFLLEADITQVHFPELDQELPDWWLAPEGTPPEVIQGIREFNRFVKDWNGQANQKDGS